MAEGLKSCPFCGSTNLHNDIDVIECETCGAIGPSTGSLPVPASWTDKAVEEWKKEAIEAWNTRADNTEEDL